MPELIEAQWRIDLSRDCGIICSGEGLLILPQALTWSIGGYSSTGPLGSNFS